MSHQSPEKTQAWEALNNDFQRIKGIHLSQLFNEDAQRFDRFSIRWNNWLLDFSKNRIDRQALEHLLALAEEMKLEEAIKALFNGEAINFTEKRPALHTALRTRNNQKIEVEGQDVMKEVNEVLDQMRNFVKRIRSGEWTGHTGKPVKNIVHVGIGGSHLGPEMACEALRPYWKEGMNVHFVANVDGSDVYESLKNVDPETTLFIIASKSFTTQETLTNAHTIRQWFLEQGFPEEAIADHFVAISTNTEGVRDFGINPANMFRFWDWVGGRFSLWSAIGLPIACIIGFERFEELLAGGHAMDGHFRESSFESNIPVILGLLSIWYTNFFDSRTEAILPYDEYLQKFPAYLQQLAMESNGKRIDREGKEVPYVTQPIVWGDRGTNSQHSFFQLLHQGTHLIPCDFIVTVFPHHFHHRHHQLLMANCFAQSEALMVGKDFATVQDEMQKQGFKESEIAGLALHRVFPGNQPSNTLVMDQLTPYNLGALCAVYEHKIFVESVIWNIDAFDQWGVELGKSLAKNIAIELEEDKNISGHDNSTNGLINFFKEMRKK